MTSTTGSSIVAPGPGPDRHDLVRRLTIALGVALAHADHPVGVGGEAAVGVAVAVVVGGLGRERERVVGAGVEAPEALVGPVGEDEVGLVEAPGPAAVLVHPGAGGEALGQHVDALAAGAVAHDLDAAALLGPGLGPPHVDQADGGLADRHALGHDQLGGDRRRPAAVRTLGHQVGSSSAASRSTTGSGA